MSYLYERACKKCKKTGLFYEEKKVDFKDFSSIGIDLVLEIRVIYCASCGHLEIENI